MSLDGDTDGGLTTTSSPTLDVKIVTAVSDEKGIPMEEFDTRLNDVIDPVALESLFRGENGSVQFEFEKCLITVSADNTVSVEQL